MSNAELQSGSEGGFEVPADRMDAPESGSTERSAGSESFNKARWYTRLAAIAALLGATAYGAHENAEASSRPTQIQLQLNGGKTAGVSVFFGENKVYEFKLTSTDNPQDVVQIGSKGDKVELLEGEFQNPTNGFKVEAFDKQGKTVPIGLSKTAAIYGPDRF